MDVWQNLLSIRRIDADPRNASAKRSWQLQSLARRRRRLSATALWPVGMLGVTATWAPQDVANNLNVPMVADGFAV